MTFVKKRYGEHSTEPMSLNVEFRPEAVSRLMA